MAEKVGALFALASFFVGLGCFYGIWVQHCVDDARQKLFAVRDKLFDEASTGKIDFQSFEYKRARASIEMLIRYAHEITIWKLLAYRFHFRPNGRPGKKTPIKALIDSTEDCNLHRDLRGIEARIQRVIARLIWKRSLLLILVVGIIKMLETARNYAKPHMETAANIAVYVAELGEENSWRKAQRTRNV